MAQHGYWVNEYLFTLITAYFSRRIFENILILICSRKDLSLLSL